MFRVEGDRVFKYVVLECQIFSVMSTEIRKSSHQKLTGGAISNVETGKKAHVFGFRLVLTFLWGFPIYRQSLIINLPKRTKRTELPGQSDYKK